MYGPLLQINKNRNTELVDLFRAADLCISSIKDISNVNIV